MCNVIPGVLPKTTNPEILGRAAGQLSTALETVKVDMKAPTPPYFDIWDVHTHINPEAYKRETEKPEMDFIREPITTLTTAFEECMARVETYKGTLPMQLIHGDLHYDNVLVAVSLSVSLSLPASFHLFPSLSVCPSVRPSVRRSFVRSVFLSLFVFLPLDPLLSPLSLSLFLSPLSLPLSE